MSFKNLLLDRDVGSKIAIVTVNRPEVRNALNKETWEEIDTMVEVLARDKETEIVIFTGAGEKAFVAGADVRALKERSMLETCMEYGNQEIVNRLANMPKVTIAAINGFALGGGLELAMACDLRIAAENAKLGQPELGLGFLPGAGGTQRLLRLVGIGKAKELILTGSIIDACGAEKIGLVNKVVPVGEALQSSKEMAKKILTKGPLAVKFAKQVINWGSSTDIGTGLTLEKLAQSILFGTEDRMEGINSFLEKRSPDYKGK